MSSTDPTPHNNKLTISSYQQSVAAYINATPPGIADVVKAWMRQVLVHLPPGTTILELGSGTGRDADYLESLGAHLQRSEVVDGFVDHMARAGHTAKQLNALTDPLGGPYGMIYANAVFLHFTPHQSRLVLAKAHQCLVPDGVVALRVKSGSGSEWESEKLGRPRFMQYWRPSELCQLLSESHFEVVELEEDRFGGITWINVIAVRRAA